MQTLKDQTQACIKELEEKVASLQQQLDEQHSLTEIADNTHNDIQKKTEKEVGALRVNAEDVLEQIWKCTVSQPCQIVYSTQVPVHIANHLNVHLGCCSASTSCITLQLG
jgi:hypothetical protein